MDDGLHFGMNSATDFHSARRIETRGFFRSRLLVFEVELKARRLREHIMGHGVIVFEHDGITSVDREFRDRKRFLLLHDHMALPSGKGAHNTHTHPQYRCDEHALEHYVSPTCRCCILPPRAPPPQDLLTDR